VVDNCCDALAGVWVHEFHEFTRIVAGGDLGFEMGEFFALIRDDSCAFVVDNCCDALAGVWVHEFHEFTRIVAGGVIWDLKWGNFSH
jgi:hypothetical protein